MRKFLLKISIFLAIFAIIYLLFFLAVDSGLKSSNYVDYTEWNEIYDGTLNSKLLILGSSRAWHQIDPQIIDSVLNTNSYNLGIDGYKLSMQVCKYDIYRKYNCAPRKIIIVLDHFSFDKREGLFNKFQFIPYFYDATLTNKLKEYKGFNWEHYSIPFFQYSGSEEVSIAGLASFLKLKSFKSDKHKGYRPEDRVWRNGFELEKKENPEGKRATVVKKVVEEFDRFLEKAKKEGIDIFMVYTPDYIEFQPHIINRDSIIDIYSNLGKKHNIPFFDYSDNIICQDKRLFIDPIHLNKKGSEIITRDVSTKLLKYCEN